MTFVAAIREKRSMNTYVEKTVRLGKNPMGDWLASKLSHRRLYAVFSQEFQQGLKVGVPDLSTTARDQGRPHRRRLPRSLV